MNNQKLKKYILNEISSELLNRAAQKQENALDDDYYLENHSEDYISRAYDRIDTFKNGAKEARRREILQKKKTAPERNRALEQPEVENTVIEIIRTVLDKEIENIFSRLTDFFKNKHMRKIKKLLKEEIFYLENAKKESVSEHQIPKRKTSKLFETIKSQTDETSSSDIKNKGQSLVDFSAYSPLQQLVLDGGRCYHFDKEWRDEIIRLTNSKMLKNDKDKLLNSIFEVFFDKFCNTIFRDFVTQPENSKFYIKTSSCYDNNLKKYKSQEQIYSFTTKKITRKSIDFKNSKYKYSKLRRIPEFEIKIHINNKNRWKDGAGQTNIHFQSDYSDFSLNALPMYSDLFNKYLNRFKEFLNEKLNFSECAKMSLMNFAYKYNSFFVTEKVVWHQGLSQTNTNSYFVVINPQFGKMCGETPDDKIIDYERITSVLDYHTIYCKNFPKDFSQRYPCLSRRSDNAKVLAYTFPKKENFEHFLNSINKNLLSKYEKLDKINGIMGCFKDYLQLPPNKRFIDLSADVFRG